ncbi:hypothetical protein Pmani_021325 [Petrolisthes manimaculis]|uniref:Uncharacterized protein n=1 Tax=Petrolisthes manimaculis TaxID=1843537 RepID=A0AAE1PE21_9EUCA|nr:hypothetical protein Pmani_021325 [Petrolisthes manimaculis]
MAVCGKSRHHPHLPITALTGDLLSMCKDWEQLSNLPELWSTDSLALMNKIMECSDCGYVVDSEPRMEARDLIDGWENIRGEESRIPWRKRDYLLPDADINRKLKKPFEIYAGSLNYRLMAVCGKSRHHPDLPTTVLSGNLRTMCQDWEALRNIPSEKLTDTNLLIHMIMNCYNCGWIEGSDPPYDVDILIDDLESIITNASNEIKDNSVPEMTTQHETRKDIWGIEGAWEKEPQHVTDETLELVILGGEKSHSHHYSYTTTQEEEEEEEEEGEEEEGERLNHLSIIIIIFLCICIAVVNHTICKCLSSYIARTLNDGST